MSEMVEVARAAFRPQSGSQRGERIEVHFNPDSLQYSVSSTLRQQGSGNSVKQFVSQSTAKLTMDLVFDTTHSGENVRTHTEKVARFMEPVQQVPPVIEFEWGAYRFQGMVESFRETISFFAPNGVPLRSTVNITLAAQDHVFAPRSGGTFEGVSGRPGSAGAVQVPGPPPMAAIGSTAAAGAAGVQTGVTAIAAAAGNPRAGRTIAAQNDVDSMRFPDVAQLVVSPGGGGRAAGPALTGGGGLQQGSGLRGRSAPGGGGGLDTKSLVKEPATRGQATDAGSSIEVGGRGTSDGPASLGADVGRGASLRDRIRFGG